MMTHVVLLQPKTEVPEDQILAVLDRVVRLQQTIPAILAVEAGKNLSRLHQGFTYGFVMQFVDAQSLRTYASHPDHQGVSVQLQQICQSIIDFDLEQPLSKP